MLERHIKRRHPKNFVVAALRLGTKKLFCVVVSTNSHSQCSMEVYVVVLFYQFCISLIQRELVVIVCHGIPMIRVKLDS
jgi:hypothetical protein